MDETARCMGIAPLQKRQKQQLSLSDVLNAEKTTGRTPVAKGQKITHKYFGKGVVVAVQATPAAVTVTAEFPQGKRMLDWEMCMKNSLVKC